MNLNLEKKLAEEFSFMRHYDSSSNPIIEHTPYPAACNDGWFGLIHEICAFLEKEAKEVEVLQIKEKFGYLCFYFSAESKRDDIDLFDEIGKIANRSSKTCEFCGDTTTAKIRGGGWIQCKCNKCQHTQLMEKVTGRLEGCARRKRNYGTVVPSMS